MTEPKNLDEMTDAELKSYAAGLAKIGKMQKHYMDAVKTECKARGLGLDVAEDCTFDGEKVGVLLATRDATGRYVVDDPIAYANVLYDIEAMLPGGRTAWEEIHYPREEAMRADYLRDLINSHGGELPQGVVYKPGRPGTITIRLDRTFIHKPFTLQDFTGMGLLELEATK